MPTIPFNNARGAASSLQMSPPFAFSDVTMSVFPLRASLPRLDTFCRNYLNQASKIVQFRPFIPFVYLVILDYGRMSLEAANMGWVSQREVAFGIPLRWMNVVDDHLEFHDWAFTSPFIFVDNELSMSTGREVYGWPKLLARLDPSVSEWVRDPHGARRVFQVSTKRATQAYAGQTQEYHPFLSVIQARTAGLLDIPPSMDAIVKPLSQISTAAAGFTRLSADLLSTFTGMASDGITGSSVLPDMFDLETFKAQLSPDKLKSWVNPKDWVPGIRDAVWSMFPRSYANTINFKQFRDAGDPHATCYQAITSAKMPVKSIKQGGMLGPQNMLLGQLDGGFRIDVHHLAGLPVVESLGLEVSQERELNGSVVSSLSPVSPFWLQVDMTYGLADTLVWRGRQGEWNPGKIDDHEKPIQTASSAVASKFDKSKNMKSGEIDANKVDNVPSDADDLGEEDEVLSLDYIRAMNFFNTARGATEALGGAFNMPNASIRVLPLKADFDTLQKFVSTYLEVKDRMEFEAWGDFVYLVICDFDQVNSELNAMSKRRAREINLVVPVKCYSLPENLESSIKSKLKVGDTNNEKYLSTTGFVSAFSFVDDVGTAITASEVSGVPSMGASIVSPENDWLNIDRSKDRQKRNILDTRAQVLPALMSGAEAEERSVIQLHSHTPPQAEIHKSQHDSIGRWVDVLADDLEKKTDELNNGSSSNARLNSFAAGQGLLMKLLGGDLPINQFSLKQFRDSRHTNEACYQGLVLRRHKIKNLSDMRELEEQLHVSITDYPTQPIAKILGLIPKLSYPGKDRTVNVFEALRPFSVTADLRREAGNTLYERIGEDNWKAVDSVENLFGWQNSNPETALKLVSKLDPTSKCDPVELRCKYKFDKYPRIFPIYIDDLGKKTTLQKFVRLLKKGKVTDFMLKNRNGAGSIGLLRRKDLKKFLASNTSLDIAAFNDQIYKANREIRYNQSEVAKALEFVSPATILDASLSQQLGLVRDAIRRPHNKPHFCVPALTVANEFVDILFPECELLHNYWPSTAQFHENENRRRRSEIYAMKSDLRFLSTHYSFLYFSKFVFSNETKSDGEVLDLILNSMRKMLPSKELALGKNSEFEMAASKARSSLGGNTDDIPDIALELVNSMLPKPFRYKSSENKSNESFIRETFGDQKKIITSNDWSELEGTLLKLFAEFEDVSIEEDELLFFIEEFQESVMDKIDSSKKEMTSFERAQIGKNTDVKFYLDQPHAILRNRVSKLVTDGIIKNSN